MSAPKLCVLALLLSMAAGSYADSGPVFEPPAVFGLPQQAKTTAIGDLNGDGRDDVAVAAWPSALYVIYQQPDGSLAPPVELYSPLSPLGLAIGDLNHDSRSDLVVGGMDGTILIYYQQSDGTFGLPGMCSGYGLVNSIVIDDFNGDGRADIADTSANLPVVLVSLQASDGTFGLPSSCLLSGLNSRSLCSLDYNSDGIRDLACLLDDKVSYLAGSLDGFLTPEANIPAVWAYSLAAGDVTGDGRDDLVYSVPDSPGYGTVAVVPQGNDGLPAPTEVYPAYAYAQALAVADLNNDGRKDVAALQSGYEAVTVLCQISDGKLGQWTSYPVPYSNNYECAALAVGDLNSDGYPDLAIADQWNGLVVVNQTPAAAGPTPDVTAPICSAQISGTLGLDGWYTSSVTARFTAEDEADGSGVRGVFVTTDGVTWSSYAEPVVISRDGVSNIGYYAEDIAGNRSQVQWAQVKLDAAAPVLTLEPLLSAIWCPQGDAVDVPVRLTARDDVSGIGRLHLAVRDEYGLVQPEMELIGDSTVNLPLVASSDNKDKDGRVYTIVLTGYDKAGNAASTTSTVTVPGSGPKKPKKVK